MATIVTPDTILRCHPLNRSAVIVKPLRPYLEWAKTDDAEGLAESVFENLRREPHLYLLPEYEEPASQQEVLEEFWPILFEAMLEGWAWSGLDSIFG
ncbi:hypothetical protein MYX78_03960 [Acidobacteria bacterium AH-259-G07]|nr:hypothetical protein [Acidobacteria bacterium AH-259-G07]